MMHPLCVCMHRNVQEAAYAPPPPDALAASSLRREQAARLLSWMDAALRGDAASGAPTASAVILAGDLNGGMEEPAQALLRRWGLVSAADATAPTWPTPAQASPAFCDALWFCALPCAYRRAPSRGRMPRPCAQAPFKEWGVPRALDFVLVRPVDAAVRVRVLAAHTAPDAPQPATPNNAGTGGGSTGGGGGVFPSDHFGVMARLELSRVEG
jgi:hypothetical protein